MYLALLLFKMNGENGVMVHLQREMRVKICIFHAVSFRGLYEINLDAVMWTQNKS